MTFSIAQANDYNGYIATYREYQRGDHYRKALTGWGPHSSDYMATRLVEMGGELQAAGRRRRRTSRWGRRTSPTRRTRTRASRRWARLASQYVPLYEATLPDDGGEAEVVEQPARHPRASAPRSVAWIGGSNYTDDPVVRVERRSGGGWVPYADQSGEVPVTLRFPQARGDAGLCERRPAVALDGALRGVRLRRSRPGRAARGDAGRHVPVRGRGPAPRGPRGRAVPSRRGRSRCARGTASRCADMRARARACRSPSGRSRRTGCPRRAGGGSRHRDEGRGGGPGDVVATVGPIDYPDSYESPRALHQPGAHRMRDPAAPNDPSRFEWYCLACSFRPWADTGRPSCAAVTVVSRTGRAREVRAAERDGRWAAPVRLRRGELALVRPGQCATASARSTQSRRRPWATAARRRSAAAATLAARRTRC